MQPILLQESGSLHGKLTTDVGSAPEQPHGRVRTSVVVHWGTRQDRQAVAVCVMVGQLAPWPPQLPLTVRVEVAVLVTVAVWVTTWRTVAVVVLTLTLSWVRVTVVVRIITLLIMAVTVLARGVTVTVSVSVIGGIATVS